MSGQQRFRIKARLAGHTGPVHALTFSSGLGQYVLTGSSDRSICLFNPDKSGEHALVQQYAGAHGHAVLSLSVCSDNSRFASGGGERTPEIVLWDVTSARTLRRFGDHSGRIESVSFAGEEDSILVSAGFDAAIRMWDCRANHAKAVMTLKDAKDSINSLVVSGTDIITGGVDGRLRSYDVRTGKVYVDVIGSPITSVGVTREADSYLVSSSDSRLRLLDRVTGTLLQDYSAESFNASEYRIRSVMLKDDSMVVSGSEDGAVFIWDTLSGRLLERVEHVVTANTKQHSGRQVVSCVASRSGSEDWASAAGDGSVIVWSPSQEAK